MEYHLLTLIKYVTAYKNKDTIAMISGKIAVSLRFSPKINVILIMKGFEKLKISKLNWEKLEQKLAKFLN